MKTVLLALILSTCWAFQQTHISVRNSVTLGNPRSRWHALTMPVQEVRKQKASTFTSLNQSSDSTPDDEKKAMEKKIEGRKKRVIVGYQLVSISQLIIGCILFVLSRNLYFAVGPLLMGGLSYILADAASHDRLSSDTYKRLNLALGESSLLALISLALFRTNNWLVTFTYLIAFINSVKGYGYGLKGWDKTKDGRAKEDITQGIMSTARSMASIKSIKSLGYWAATLTMGYMKVLKMREIIQMISDGSKGALIATRLIRTAKLVLFTFISFTLKDAADRSRLEGTTFINLNFMLSFSFAAMAGYIMDSAYSAFGGYVAFLSAFSAYNGIASTMKKKKTAYT